jgi:hypothetical protein
LATGDLFKSAIPDVRATLLFRNADRAVPVGSTPVTVVAGQFDQNEPIDLATANLYDESISILAGDGSGSFLEVQRVPVGSLPLGLVVADLNLDGLDELAFVAAPEHLLGALINAGAEGFVRSPVFYSGQGPWSVDTDDIDGDGAPDLLVSNLASDSIGVFVNQIERRVDPNGSNRVDGFDIAEVSRLFDVTASSDDFRRTHDIDLNGRIDGDDLALVASNFGRLMKEASPLSAKLLDPQDTDPGTISLQSGEQDGDRLIVDVEINDDVHPATAAEFSVNFESSSGEGGTEEIVRVIGYESGDYFSGGLNQIYSLDLSQPNVAGISISRLPDLDRVGSGPQRLLSLILEARKVGQTTIDFAPVNDRDRPTLLDDSGNEVAGVSFVGGVMASVETKPDAAPGQRIGFSPSPLDFGTVSVGSSSKERLRVANFGYADLIVESVISTIPEEFESFFTSEFTIPPFGSVELPLQFTPSQPGVYAGELVIESNDPERQFVRARLLGRSDLSVTVTPSFVDFGSVALGGSTIRRVGIGNRGSTPLVYAGHASSNPAFTADIQFTVINPGEFVSVDLSFEPESTGEISGLLTMDFDSPERTSLVLTLEGSGHAGR